jgi:tetratricopeptide (TPR) repeat protein
VSRDETRGPRRRGAGRRGLLALVLVGAVAAVGCRDAIELSRRFDAERDRWRTDRLEAGWRQRGGIGPERRARLRDFHLRIARRHGGKRAPTASELADPDVALRFRIAGSSALYAADLASVQGASEEVAREYDRVAEVYEFDRGIHVRARIGEGWTRERLGQTERALALYEELVVRGPVETEGWFGSAEVLLLDLEPHLAIVARERFGTEAARAVALRSVDRLEARRKEGGGGRRLVLRLAECRFLAGDWERGLAELEPLFDSAGSDEERADLALEIAQAAEFGAGDLERAEHWYRRSIERGTAIPSAAEARLRLGDLLTRTRRAGEGLDLLDELLGLGARVLQHREAEALVAKSRALVALDRWEDALPVLDSAIGLDPGDPWSLVAAADVHARMRGFTRPEAGPAARTLVAAAERVPSPAGPSGPPRRWSEFEAERRSRDVWRRAVRELLRVAGSADDSDTRSAARTQAGRLARERVRDAEWAERIDPGGGSAESP